MNEFSIQNITELPRGASQQNRQTLKPDSDSFSRILVGSLDRVNRLQLEAEANVDNLANGRQTDIHQTMIAVEKASVSFDLLMQLRNKLISAYDKIMRMPI